MPLPDEDPSPYLLALALAALLAVSACAAVWTLVAVRWSQRRPIIPYQPRRSVPWGGWDLLFIVVFYFFAQSGVAAVAPWRWAPPPPCPRQATTRTSPAPSIP